MGPGAARIKGVSKQSIWRWIRYGRAGVPIFMWRIGAVNADRLPNLDPAVLRQAPSIQFDESVVSTVRLGYERDTRNDPFVPTSGEQLSFGIELGTSLLGSDYEFSKYTGAGSIAIEPFPAHSLVFRAEAGLIQGEAPFFDPTREPDPSYARVGEAA